MELIAFILNTFREPSIVIWTVMISKPYQYRLSVALTAQPSNFKVPVIQHIFLLKVKGKVIPVTDSGGP
jgi:hypothetical protein